MNSFALQAGGTLLPAIVLATGLAGATPARAELPTEIRVYDDLIDDPGEFGFEVHTSRTFQRSHRTEPSSELSHTRGMRITPEFSYGVNEHAEVSILIPVVIDSTGTSYVGGQQLQFKWLPFKAPAEGGLFAGINWELVTATKRFDQARNGVEIRPIVGYRDHQWAVIANFLTSYSLTKGYRQGGIDLKPAFKVSRAIGEGLHGGVEYYAEVGKLARFSPHDEQTHTAYLTLDVEREGWKVNFGIGRGLNSATDPWIVKAIVEFPVSD